LNSQLLHASDSVDPSRVDSNNKPLITGMRSIKESEEAIETTKQQTGCSTLSHFSFFLFLDNTIELKIPPPHRFGQDF
jgi:hypothetical protein